MAEITLCKDEITFKKLVEAAGRYEHLILSFKFLVMLSQQIFFEVINFF